MTGPALTRQEAAAAPAAKGIQLGLAAFVLVLGTLVYALDRPAESAPIFGAVGLSQLSPGFFGRIGDSLPTFSHVFALSLLTSTWLGGGRKLGLAASFAWFGVDIGFEVGQHAQFAQRLADGIPRWFDAVPILGRADGYFLLGTFDAWDMMSIALGAAAAYLVIRCTAPRVGHDV